MPIDHKRINGPEVSVPYTTYINAKCEEKYAKNFIFKRKDGRAHNERREICKFKYKTKYYFVYRELNLMVSYTPKLICKSYYL